MLNFLSAIKLTPLFIIGIISGLVFIVTLIFNIKNKSFSPLKFISGFNIFNGQVQGKLIYFFIIFSFVIAVALGIYHKIIQPTTNYDTNYRNEVKQNGEVVIDQRVITIENPESVNILAVEILGIKLKLTHPFKRKTKIPEVTAKNNIKKN